MKRLFILTAGLVAGMYAMACTNFIVGKKASADGSVICSYNADSYGAFMWLYHYPAAKHQKGEIKSAAKIRKINDYSYFSFDKCWFSNLVPAWWVCRRGGASAAFDGDDRLTA